MALYSEYEEYTKKYVKEYGPNTVVLYRCGGFYEIYSINDGLVDMKRISELLNIQVSRRNKAILEVNRSNTLMAGFPMYALQKFITILVNDNYTVVVVDQVTDPPKPKRAVTSIVSPGTDIVNIHNPDAKNLMSIYVDQIRDAKTKKKFMAVGIAIIDLSTGKSKVTECASSLEDPLYALDETYRVMQAEDPREIVIFGQDEESKNIILQHLGLGTDTSRICVHDKFLDYDVAVEQLAYQNQLLHKVFPGHGLLTAIEYLDLEKLPLATVSFVYLLQFTFKHNENILQKIQKPMLDDAAKCLNLSYNCVRHLNILPTGDFKENCLLGLLNKTCTAMGRRLFREWLLSPLVDCDKIKERYIIIGDMMKDKKYEGIQAHLNQVYDIERLARRIGLGLLHPCELTQLHMSLTKVSEVVAALGAGELRNVGLALVESATQLVGFLESQVDFHEIQKYNQDNISRNFFLPKVYDGIDSLQSELDKEASFIEDVCKALNSAAGADVFKVDFNQVDRHHLVITSKRFNDVKAGLKGFKYGQEFTFSDINAKPLPSKTGLKLHHDSFKRVNDAVEALQDSLVKEIKEKYMLFLKELGTYNGLMYDVAKYVAEVDFYASNAKTACVYRYHCPIISDEYEGKSFVTGTDMRHPIIERLCTTVPYVANDVRIGTPDTNGMLLYGTNMVGKSSYMKALGVCLIMAQTGMFVPCRNFKYFPYKHVFTRIPSGDDLFKGQSTFAVEIMELRNILRRADHNSLVIGDELASGTESVSAVAIVGAGIVQLASQRASFVFATHLHDLTKLQRIQTLSTLRIFHLKVEYDEESKKLVYDRRLKEGQGGTLYGLEVCRALDLPDNFLTLSNEFRQEMLAIEPCIVSTKRSRYNQGHFVDNCDICHAKGVEVHHIKHQALADTEGFIGDVHKNVKHNLANVCTACHDRIHRGEIHVDGYVQTTQGVELKFSEADVPETHDVNSLVLELRAKGFSLQRIKSHLQEKGIDMTVYKVNKLLRQRA